MDQVSSRNLPEVYANLGINTNKLGCIMLDGATENPSKPAVLLTRDTFITIPRMSSHKGS